MIDRELSVSIHRALLLQVVATILSMLGGLSVDTVLRKTHLSVLVLLRPAESATRRLIAMLAHGLVVPERKVRSGPVGTIRKGSDEKIPAFPLFDPRPNVDPKKKHIPGFGPNIRGFDGFGITPPAAHEPHPDDPVSAAHLCKRLRSLQAALDNLRYHARRLARALAKKPRPIRAIRPGRPPGYRKHWQHPVDEILRDCHQLALMVLNEPVPDTKAPP